MRLALYTFFAALLLPNALLGQQIFRFEPEIKRVAVFKNGYAFTYREGETTLSNGWAYTSKIPVGVLGTVWGYSNDPGTKVVQLIASEEEKGETENVWNLAEFLIANRGKRATFYLINHGTELTGQYDLLNPELDIEALRRSYGRGYNLPGQNVRELTVALKTESGTLAFPVGSVKMVEVLGESVNTLPRKTKQIGVKFDGDPSATRSLGIAALERGIRWIPAYRVEVKGSPIKEAKLELEAMVINELADLKGSEVFFVVGSPSFLFQDLISPLSINSVFAGVSSYFSSGARGGGPSAAVARQVYSSTSDSSYGSQGDGKPTVADEEKLETFSAEQLFLYKSEKLDLKKGENASLRLFSLTVPAGEVFEWTIDDPSNIEQRYQNNGAASLSEMSEGIWSALRLRNTTKMPWTTGPALTFRDWKPIGQNIIRFTPVGGERIVRVTPATEVLGTHSLAETSRERVQLTYGGHNYNFDLVTLEGTVNLRNLKEEAVELLLTRNLVGDVVDTELNGSTTRKGIDLRSFNPASTINWKLSLPSGETKLKYTYKVYVSR